MLAPALFLISQALGRASSFVLGWATSLFFGQIPGGKERVVSMLSAMALAWVLITYAGGTIAAIALLLQAAHVITFRDPSIDDARIVSLVIGIVVIPPLAILVAEASHLGPPFSLGRLVRRIPSSYAVALSLGLGVALMIVIGPIVLIRRRRRGLRTHHIPVLVADADFHAVVEEIARVLRDETGEEPVVGGLAGLWALPMRATRFAAAHLFNSVVRPDPVIVAAGDCEVVAHAMDVHVTAPEKDAYALRSALYKAFGVARMHLTWSGTSQVLERRLWELRDERRGDPSRRLDALERDIDAAPIGSDEWNVLYRVVLQLRAEVAERARRTA